MPAERVIVTDTAASISPKQAALIGVAMIPLHIIWPDQSQSLDTEFFDDPVSFYDKMEHYQSEGMGLPKTSAPSAGEFFQLYEQLRAQGAREIGSVHVTSKKSAVYSSAVQGAKLAQEKYSDLTIQVIDSCAVSLPQWFLVQAAREMMGQGLSLEEINKQILDNIKNDCNVLYAMISSLRNLVESGRVSGAASLAASLLSIRALVQLKNGDLELYAKEYGTNKALRAIVERLNQDFNRRGLPTKVGVIYTGDKEIGEKLQAALGNIDKENGVEFVGPIEAGVILGIHTGRRTGAVTAYW